MTAAAIATGLTGALVVPSATVLAVNPCVAGGAGVTRWVGGAAGDWEVVGNWDGGVPTAATIACITGPTSHTVQVGKSFGPVEAKSIELGSSGGTQTLVILGAPRHHNGLLTLVNQDPTLGVETNGTILLAETQDDGGVPAATSGAVNVTAGTLTNRGTIVSRNLNSGPNALRGNFDNQGTFTLNESLFSDHPATWKNSGTMTIASGKSFTLSPSGAGSFTQTAGSIVNNGVFEQHGGTFTANGNGVQTGNPLQFTGGVTINPSGTGSGSFDVRSGADILGSDIAAGYIVRVAGEVTNHNGLLSTAVTRTNHGTILLGSTDGTVGRIEATGGATLINASTIISDAESQPVFWNSLGGNFVNQGTLTINANFYSPSVATWTSSGAISIAAGVKVEMKWDSGASFTQTAGTFVNNGSYLQYGGAFLATGTGIQTGNGLMFQSGVTISPSGTGTGNFEVRSGSDVLATDIGAGYTVRIAGVPTNHHGVLNVPASRTNNGTILLGGQDGTRGQLVVQSGPLTNLGTIRADYITPGLAGGPNRIDGAIDNHGTIAAEITDIEGLGDITNNGTIDIAAERALSATSLTQTAAGTLSINVSGANASKVTTTGPASLAGTLHVTAANVLNSTYRILDSQARTGTFTPTFTGQGATVNYDATGASLGSFTAAPPSGPGAAAYAALVPARLLETRPGMSTVDGQFAGGGVQAGGSVLELVVAGRAGVPGDASAAVLNVTVTDAGGAGFVTVFPCGSPQPTASNLNFVAGSTVPNLVIAKVGVGGKVCLFTSQPTNLIVDVNGYFPAGAAYAALVPARLLETRPGMSTVDGQFAGGGVQAGGSVLELVVAGRAGVPGDASAAVLNVTVTDAGGAGFVTVFPCGSPQPTASNLNFVAGSTVPNLVIAKVGVGGKVCLFTSQPTNLIVDVNGYFPAGAAYAALVPARLLETRPGMSTVDGQFAGGGVQAGGSVLELVVAGRAGVPGDASAAVLNVTVTDAGGAGFVTVFPCGSPQPTASNLNFVAGSTVPNLVIAKVGVGGQVCLFTSQPTNLIVDVNGYFPG